MEDPLGTHPLFSIYILPDWEHRQGNDLHAKAKKKSLHRRHIVNTVRHKFKEKNLDCKHSKHKFTFIQIKSARRTAPPSRTRAQIGILKIN